MSDEHYVFTVFDPHATNTPIYVGTGTGDACDKFTQFSHPNNPELDRVMREYRAAGLKPKARIVKRFAARGEAVIYKRKLIQQYGHSDAGTVTLLNISIRLCRDAALRAWKTHPKLIAKRELVAKRLAAVAKRKAARAAARLYE